MAGVTSTGFVPKTLEEVTTSLQAAFRARFGEGITTEPESNFGKLIGIFSALLAEVWDQGEAVYSAFTPDGATGAALDALAGLTGTVRRAASHSTVTVTATGTPGTVLPAGRVFSVVGTGVRFATLADATIGGGGTVSVACEAEETGPLTASAGTLTVIETPVSGLTSVTNPLDATVGANEETDAELRVRRELELRAQGGGSVPAIEAELLRVSGVTAAVVFENTSGTTDSDGLPPKSVECVVSGGADADIRQAIYDTKAAGVETYGDITGTVTDSEGTAHTIEFSRPGLLPIHVVINLKVNPSLFPSDGATLVKEALVEWADSYYRIGRDVVASTLYPTVLAAVPGVLDVSSLFIGTAASPGTNATITVGVRQLAELDTSRITVVTTPGSV
jgi:uncharacterized phage protein gp47/JayE